MRSFVGILLLVFAMVLVGCQPVTVEQAAANYCQSLEAFNTARLAVKGLEENSTIDETKAAFASLRVAFNDVKQSSSMVTEAELAALEQSYDDLMNVESSIEGSMTLGEAQATVQESQAAVDAAWEQLYADADCVNVTAAE